MNTLFQWLVELLRGVIPWVIVAPWEVAIRIRLGKFTKMLSAGIHFRFPYFDEFMIVNTRVRIATTTMQTITTKDGRAVSLAASIGFRLTDPLASFKRLSEPTATISAYATTLLTEYVLDKTLSEVSIGDLRKSILDGLRIFGSGMEFEFVSITDFAVVKTFRLLQEGGRQGVWGDGSSASLNGIRPY